MNVKITKRNEERSGFGKSLLLNELFACYEEMLMRSVQIGRYECFPPSRYEFDDTRIHVACYLLLSAHSLSYVYPLDILEIRYYSEASNSCPTRESRSIPQKSNLIQQPNCRDFIDIDHVSKSAVASTINQDEKEMDE